MAVYALPLLPAIVLALLQSETETDTGAEPEPATEVAATEPTTEPTTETATEPTTEPTTETAATPAAAPAPAPAATPADAELTRYNQWGLHIAPGGTYIRGQGFTAGGPLFRLNAWSHGWRNKFLIGGGPSLHYSLLLDREADDQIHMATINGDLIIGGGKPGKFAIYGHLTLGLGILRAHDGATGLTITLPGGRAGAGVGGHAYIKPRISIGALVDFGYLGGLGVDAMAMVGFHFGRKPK